MLNSAGFTKISSKTGMYVAAAFFTLLMVFPVYWLFATSLKADVDMYRIPPIWFPKPTLDNYVQAFAMRPLWQYIFNSVIITTLTTLISVLIGSMAGYGFSRFKFKGSGALLMGILATRMIPPITLVFPLFILMRNLQLLDSHLALILAYTTFNTPFAIFLMYGFFENVPQELEEAAVIDGCSRVTAFYRIILPLSLPGVISTSIMCILLAWKDFLWALRFTYSPASQTIPVGITTYISNVGIAWGPVTAVGSLSVLPLLIFSLIVQKYMVKGLMAGAVKG
jgi:multiple sugar transport system permease protein